MAEILSETLMEGLEKALDDLRLGKIVDPSICHTRVSTLYSWQNVTQRTEKVYTSITKESTKSIGLQLRSYMRSNVMPFLLVVSLMYLILQILEWFVPRQDIDTARTYRKKPHKHQH